MKAVPFGIKGNSIKIVVCVVSNLPLSMREMKLKLLI